MKQLYLRNDRFHQQIDNLYVDQTDFVRILKIANSAIDIKNISIHLNDWLSMNSRELKTSKNNQNER
jgi:hypothetical protein